MTGNDGLLDSLTAALRTAEGDEAELVVMTGREDLARAGNSVVHQHVSREGARVLARVLREGRTGCAQAQGLGPEALGRALTDAGELARFAPRDPDHPGLPGPGPVPDLVTHVPATAAVTPAQRADAFREVFARAASHGLDVAGAIATGESTLAVVNTKGIAVQAPLTTAAANVVALGEDSSGYACGISRDIAEVDVVALADRAIEKALRGARPTEIDAGSYEVILEPPALAELMEWMTYTCFGAQGIQDETSALAGRLGQALMGENVTLYDDATEQAGMPTPFDFEGQPKHRLDIVSRGVARGFGTDSLWAARLGTVNTAHALPKSGEGEPPYR